jgi:glycine/D-amino acid oxidase-like deaminating enzyme
MTSDVTIFGAGLFGLGVAWACASRGARVRVVDPAGPGAGASGGLVGALAPLAGVLLADLILEGRDRIPPEFRPETRA